MRSGTPGIECRSTRRWRSALRGIAPMRSIVPAARCQRACKTQCAFRPSAQAGKLEEGSLNQSPEYRMDVLDAIGNTSMVRLRKIVPLDCADVFVKLEWENPTGSMKDRM